MYYLGIDLGSSSLKLALVASDTGLRKEMISYPEQEMSISSAQQDWAEQSPAQWWEYLVSGVLRLFEKAGLPPSEVIGIGIGYQMHGLVLLDESGDPLRDAIIWCDSRAIDSGLALGKSLGQQYCVDHLLNNPGNFTASKLDWVRSFEPELFAKAKYFMLPGDYLAFRLTGVPSTTSTGLSEGIMWDFYKNGPAMEMLRAIPGATELLPQLVPILGEQGQVSSSAAKALGISAGTPLLYRAGDQPNNALSLHVMDPGQVAATGGTSGVVYAVNDSTSFKELNRLNHFIHVNHNASRRRLGTLLCINGCGILYRWLSQLFDGLSYTEMNKLAEQVPIGSEGLSILPFGNGAERILENRNLGGHISGLNFNRHNRAHLCRAGLEGIAFSFYYGFELLAKEGVNTQSIRTGNDNLFQSKVMAQTVANLLQVEIEVFETTGAEGAARACALAEDRKIEFKQMILQDYLKSYYPEKQNKHYLEAYEVWKTELLKRIQEA